jgi:ABC-2 type transport system ATP-binding protein
MSILTVENLSKTYGRIQALKNVNFSVPEGTVFGILGPNGSGKTTTLGTITDIRKSEHCWKRRIFTIIYPV